MNSVATALGHAVVIRFSLALVHFLWQGAALAVVALLLLGALRHAPPSARYLALLGVLAALAIAPVATFVLLPEGRGHAGMMSVPLEQDSQDSQLPTRAAPVPPPPAGDASGLPADTSPSEGNALLAALSSGLAGAREWLGAHLAWIAAGWLAGVLVLSLRLLLGWVGVARAKRCGVPPAGSQWQTVLSTLAERLRVRQSVRLLESAMAGVPAVIGWLRPVILVPTCAFSGLTPEQLEALIAHELAHIRRHDYLVNLVQTVIETLLFYHPAVWWVSGRLRVEREHCCDDMAVACCGDSLTYARALTEMGRLRSVLRQPALSARGGSLLSRIRRLADAAAPPSKPAPSWPAGAIALAAVVAMGLSFHAVAARAAQPATLGSGAAHENHAQLVYIKGDSVWTRVIEDTGFPVRGGRSQKLLRIGRRREYDSVQLLTSPDGRHLIVAHNIPMNVVHHRSYTSMTESTPRLWLLDLKPNGKVVARELKEVSVSGLSSRRQLSFSPAGNKIVFAGYHHRGKARSGSIGLFILDVESAAITPLVPRCSDEEPFWAADKIAASERSGSTRSRAVVRNAHTGRIEFGTSYMKDISHPTLSPDSRYLTFATLWDLPPPNRKRPADRVVDLQTGRQVRVPLPEGYRDANVETWTRDGKNILWSLGRPDALTKVFSMLIMRYDLWLISLDGKTERKITEMSPGSTPYVQFSPDERHVIWLTAKSSYGPGTGKSNVVWQAIDNAAARSEFIVEQVDTFAIMPK